MAKKMFTKAGVGLEETIGTAAAITARLPITDIAALVETPTKSDTGIIIGRNSQSGKSLDCIEYSAEVPVPISPCAANRICFKSLFGTETEPADIGGMIALIYKGSSASCKISIASGTIKAYIGELGAEALDTAFGTAGTYTPSADMTLAALVTALTTGSYECRILNGEETGTFNTFIADSDQQAKNHAVPIAVAGTKAKLRIYKPNYTEGENPTLSFQSEGLGTTEKAIGGAIDKLSVSAALKAKVTGTWSLVFFSKVAGTVANMPATLKLGSAENDALKFQNGITMIGGKIFDYPKDISFNFANNISADEGWSQGGMTKSKHFRGVFAVSGSIKLTVDDDAELERAKVCSDDESSIMASYLGDDIGGIKRGMIIDMATVQYSSESKSAGSSAIELSMDYSAVDFNSYSDYARVYLVSED